MGKDPDPASKQWNYGAVQSVTGGVILPDDSAEVSSMLTYAGGQSGYGTMGISPGCTVGAAELRRDGFAQVILETFRFFKNATKIHFNKSFCSGQMVNRGAGEASLLTRPLNWGSEKTQLFLNCAGGVTVDVLGADGAVRPML